jgi:predicted nucleotidyltransferase
MRLTSEQASIIRDGVKNHLGSNTLIWLFGSRVDDSRRGGDIDLYLETQRHPTLTETLRCKIELEEKLDLHVDLVIKPPDLDKPIFNIAKAQGVRL